MHEATVLAEPDHNPYPVDGQRSHLKQQQGMVQGRSEQAKDAKHKKCSFRYLMWLSQKSAPIPPAFHSPAERPASHSSSTRLSQPPKPCIEAVDQRPRRQLIIGHMDPQILAYSHKHPQRPFREHWTFHHPVPGGPPRHPAHGRCQLAWWHGAYDRPLGCSPCQSRPSRPALCQESAL